MFLLVLFANMYSHRTMTQHLDSCLDFYWLEYPSPLQMYVSCRHSYLPSFPPPIAPFTLSQSSFFHHLYTFYLQIHAAPHIKTFLRLGSNVFFKSKEPINIKSSSDSESRPESCPQSNSGRLDCIWRQVA